MNGPRHLLQSARVSVKLLLACALPVLAGCSKSDGPPSRQEFERAAQGQDRKPLAKPNLLALSAEALSARPAASLSAPIASALIAIRQRAESLAAPPPLARHLAFGKGFIVQINANEAIVRNSTSGDELTRVSLKEPRAAVGLPAGSALVAALDGSYRFDPGQKRPHKLPRLSLLPGFALEPRRDRQDLLWVLQSQNVQLYALTPDAEPGPETERPLPDYDGRAFTTLRDGSFLYTTAEGTALIHSGGFGRPRTFLLPVGSGTVWRLGAADRIDRAWVATVSGDVLLVGLVPRFEVAGVFHTGLGPFDFAGTASGFALVSVREAAEEPRQFSLNVFSRAGQQIYSHALRSIQVTADADWVARASLDEEVVIGEAQARIAVGGANSLRVFELATGKELFAR